MASLAALTKTSALSNGHTSLQLRPSGLPLKEGQVASFNRDQNLIH